MPKRVSTYLSDNTLAFVGESESLSGRINQVVDRYSEILRRERPRVLARFSDAERAAMQAACLTWLAEPAATIPGGVLAEVLDSDPEQIGLSAAEAGGLHAKLESLSTSEQMALVEWIETARAHPAE